MKKSTSFLLPTKNKIIVLTLDSQPYGNSVIYDKETNTMYIQFGRVVTSFNKLSTRPLAKWEEAAKKELMDPGGLLVIDDGGSYAWEIKFNDRPERAGNIEFKPYELTIIGSNELDIVLVEHCVKTMLEMSHELRNNKPTNIKRWYDVTKTVALHYQTTALLEEFNYNKELQHVNFG